MKYDPALTAHSHTSVWISLLAQQFITLCDWSYLFIFQALCAWICFFQSRQHGTEKCCIVQRFKLPSALKKQKKKKLLIQNELRGQLFCLHSNQRVTGFRKVLYQCDEVLWFMRYMVKAGHEMKYSYCDRSFNLHAQILIFSSRIVNAPWDLLSICIIRS